MHKYWQIIYLTCFIVFFTGTSLANEVYGQGDIPLLKNRFRIDHGIGQATFIIYRKPNSAAAILVRPNGSKIFAWKLPKNVHWLETDAVDIITIDKPMPGPWQAIADTDPRNRIKIISDISLRVQMLPAQVYKNEELKLVAKLVNKSDVLILDDYLHDAMMSLTLFPIGVIDESKITNKEDFAIPIGSYSDNAESLDERPGDGIFTALANLDVKPGKYQLRISTKSEVFSRAYNQTILVYPVPVSLLILRDNENKEFPKLTFNFDDDELDLDSIYISAELKTPFGESYPFTAYARGKKALEIILPETEFKMGHYQISGTMFAVSRLGRDLMINLPVKRFLYTPEIAPLDLNAISAARAAQQLVTEEQARVAEEKRKNLILLWIGIAVGGVIVSLILIVFILKKRKLKQLLANEIEVPIEKPMKAVDMSEDNVDLNMPED